MGFLLSADPSVILRGLQPASCRAIRRSDTESQSERRPAGRRSKIELKGLIHFTSPRSRESPGVSWTRAPGWSGSSSPAWRPNRGFDHSQRGWPRRRTHLDFPVPGQKSCYWKGAVIAVSSSSSSNYSRIPYTPLGTSPGRSRRCPRACRF